MLRIVNECQFLYDLHTMMTTLLLPRVSKWGGDDGKKSFILTMSLTTTRQDIHHVFFILFFFFRVLFSHALTRHTHTYFSVLRASMCSLMAFFFREIEKRKFSGGFSYFHTAIYLVLSCCCLFVVGVGIICIYVN